MTFVEKKVNSSLRCIPFISTICKCGSFCTGVTVREDNNSVISQLIGVASAAAVGEIDFSTEVGDGVGFGVVVALRYDTRR